jgi:hypothetical protein
VGFNDYEIAFEKLQRFLGVKPAEFSCFTVAN